jgi:energy-coupling factor transporter ATP-binding protein EcfA2
VALAELDRLTYRYPGATEPALREVTLRVAGGLTLVAGPSGGGKSTLLRVFNGLVPHFHGGQVSGRANLAGSNIIETRTRDLARHVGFVFQDPELQTVYATVDREVAFGLENAAVPAADIPARVAEALNDAGVAHLAGRAMRTLSGGERQRVALASALAMRPQMVVLDEPTSQLDDEGAGLVLAAARRVVSQGRTVIVSEHRLRALMAAADQLVTVDDGRVSLTDPRGWREPRFSPAAAARSSGGSEVVCISGAAAGFDGRRVLEGVELAVRSGEVVALMGPNGGGKTTLLRLIAGLLSPIAGTVERRPGRIAYLPQNPAALLHRPTVRDEVRFTIERSGEQEKPETILAELGLLDVAGRYPRDLSSGERQRAAVAAVLAGSPGLVLLDEPTRGMDARAAEALVRLATRLRERGAAVVIATHDSDLRAAVADRVLMVAGGRVLPAPAEVLGK